VADRLCGSRGDELSRLIREKFLMEVEAVAVVLTDVQFATQHPTRRLSRSSYLVRLRLGRWAARGELGWRAIP
jgi:hypothetical protein